MVAASFLVPAEALSQVGATAYVTGVVKDPSGAVILGARVTASKLNSNLIRTTQTDATGHFSMLRLAPGRYVLHVEAMKFKAAETIVEVRFGNSEPITIVLAVQVTEQTVTVEGASTDLETAAMEHTNISSSLTDALPNTAVNGGFSRVLTLGTPGVAAESNGGFHPLGEHAEVSFSIDGQPISDQFRCKPVIRGLAISWRLMLLMAGVFLTRRSFSRCMPQEMPKRSSTDSTRRLLPLIRFTSTHRLHDHGFKLQIPTINKRVDRTNVNLWAVAISPQPIRIPSIPYGSWISIFGGAETGSTTIHPPMYLPTSLLRFHKSVRW
jgi:hypothetical protein